MNIESHAPGPKEPEKSDLPLELQMSANGLQTGDSGSSAGTSHSLPSVVIPVAFGATVAMWGVGYVSHLEFVTFPRFALLLMILIQVLAGRAAAFRHPRALRAGIATGLLVSTLNLLILASLLREPGEDGESASLASALLPMVEFWVVGGVLGGLGSLWVSSDRELRPFDPPLIFTRIAAAATFLLVVIGGIVTSNEAGLAVPDWPASFEANMFLLPLSKMVSESAIYYEHAHRLFGALVGLTTVALFPFLWVMDRRRWVRGFAAWAVVLVVAQGAMGGLRVVLADNENNIENFWSLVLRVAHGVSGQVFFATLVALAAFVSPNWRTPTIEKTQSFVAERQLTMLLLLISLGQLVLGALVRHIDRAWLIPHIGGAVLVGGLAVWVAVRATTLFPETPQVRGSGVALLFLVITQWLLGFFSLAVTGGDDVREKSNGALQTIVTTMHQAMGALILATVTLHLIGVWRHLRPLDRAVPAR